MSGNLEVSLNSAVSEDFRRACYRKEGIIIYITARKNWLERNFSKENHDAYCKEYKICQERLKKEEKYVLEVN